MEITTATDSGISTRTKAFFALLLLVPAPFIGTWFGLYSTETRGTFFGQTIYVAGKIWILVLPLFWLFFVDRARPSFSPARRGGWAAGIISGLLISTGILIIWIVVGRHWIDREIVREAILAAGLGTPLHYALFAVYIFTINAVLEEYVWRWFVFRKSADLLGKAGIGAVILSALFFTLHHIIALLAQFDPLPTFLAAFGVFVGGCIWSGLYLKYRSIWPGFVSHAIVDIAIFAIGARILFFET